MIPYSPLFKLPSEILTAILADLSLHSLIACRKTCKKLKELYDSSSQLQYIAELEIAGMKDNPYCSMNVSERLELLRKREDAWAALQPDFSATISIPKAPAGIYDVTPNNYLLGVATLPDEMLTLGIQSITLPSSAEGALAVPSTIINLTKHIVDFGTSIEEHDLLATVTIAPSSDLRLFSLEITLFRHSTGTLHEEAEKPIIQLMQVDSAVSISIEISGENLAIIVSPRNPRRDNELHVFNWKKGTRKGLPMSAPNLGLCYLREDLLLMPDLETPSLDIVHIPHSVPGVHDEDLPISCIAELALPPLARGQQIGHVQCRCDPSPTAGHNYPQYSPQTRPFSNDPQRAIMIMEMGFFDVDERKSYTAFMHRSALLGLLPEGWESQIKLPEPNIAPNSAWSMEGAPELANEPSLFSNPPPSEDTSSDASLQPEPSSSVSGQAFTQPSDSTPTDQYTPAGSNAEATNAEGAEGFQASHGPVIALLSQDEDDSDDDGDEDDEDDDDGEDLDMEVYAELLSAQDIAVALNYEPFALNPAPDGNTMHAILNTPGDATDPMEDGFESDSSDGTNSPSLIPWTDWGPKTTRWLDASKFSSVYITSTAGQRFVSIDKGSRTQNSPIRVLDFNPYHVRKAHLTNERYPCTDRLVGVGPEELQAGSEICPSGGLFEQDIVSKLPYIESSTETYHGYDAVLLDEQRIIGIINAGAHEFSSVKDVAILHYG